MKEFFFKFERIILKSIRKLVYGNKCAAKKTVLMDGESLNGYIWQALESSSPFMVARFGSIELESGLYSYLLSKPLLARYKMFLQRKISFLHKDDSYARSLVEPLCNNAGFFPKDISLLKEFSKTMQTDAAILDCCCCCCWESEDLFADIYSQSIKFAKLEDMEPYDYSQPWSKALEGKKVLVIHPFEKSIKAQYAKRKLIWDNPDVLPDFELKTIKAVQTIAGEKAPFKDWFEALDYMKAQMDATDYDVAIIGCGAYGFHLAAHAKRTGHKAVHLGGATQILFGIKGKRWEELPAVSKFFNEHWTSPLPEETPHNSKKVEDGCYW